MLNARFDFINTLSIPAVLTNHQSLIVECNPSFHNFVNHDPQHEMIDQLFHDWRVWGDHMIYAKFEDQPCILFFDALKWHDSRFNLYFVTNGALIKTLQKKTAELKDANQLLNTIIENTPDVIYITDCDGNTLSVSPGIERLFGVNKEEYIGKNVKDFVRTGKFRESMTLKVLHEGKMVNSVAKTDSLNLKTAVPVVNERGDIYKVVTFVRNVTELNQMYDRLNEALKLKDQYKKELDSIKGAEMVIKSKKMKEVYETAHRIANVDTTTLILGETGVGKDVLAEHLYKIGNRYEKGKFIIVNCGAIPPDLLESELFGYESGAFTGAKQSGKSGMFELADGGVLFLDEVGDIPLALQVKLLRVLQEKQIQRVGSTTFKKIDVKLIAATNRNLQKMVEQGEFREDLYYRLHVVPITLPPLRERKADILPLVQSRIQKINLKYKLNKTFDQNLKEFLYQYGWPGNIRELSNLVERLILTVPRALIGIEDLPLEYQKEQKMKEPFSKVNSHLTGQRRIRPLKEAVEETEREILAKAVETFDSTYKIAKELETSQTTVVRKLKKYGLGPSHDSAFNEPKIE